MKKLNWAYITETSLYVAVIVWIIATCKRGYVAFGGEIFIPLIPLFMWFIESHGGWDFD